MFFFSFVFVYVFVFFFVCFLFVFFGMRRYNFPLDTFPVKELPKFPIFPAIFIALTFSCHIT